MPTLHTARLHVRVIIVPVRQICLTNLDHSNQQKSTIQMLRFYDREGYKIDLEQQLTYCDNPTCLGEP